MVSAGPWRRSSGRPHAGQGSPAPERQRSTFLESSPAVTTAPQPSPVGESFEVFYKSVSDRPLGAGAHPRAVERPPSLHVFQHHRHQKRRAPPAAKWFRSPCFSSPGRSSGRRSGQVQRLKHRPRRPKSLATRIRKGKPKLAAVLPRKSGKSPRRTVRRTSQTPFLKSTNGSPLHSISQRRRRRR